MAQKTILDTNQRLLLEIISGDVGICRKFYLTGGTALAEFYLQHRYSEDLDFFSEQEFDPAAISVFLKSIRNKAGIKQIAVEQSFNRNLYFLSMKHGGIVKTEFTYFPFPRIESQKKIDKLAVDSLLDIAVNKLFTIYQKPRLRDFIDLFFIVRQTDWSIDDLLAKAKIKFDWHIDPVQLGSRFLQVKQIEDYPRMIIKVNHAEWQNFFLQEAKKMEKKILK